MDMGHGQALEMEALCRHAARTLHAQMEEVVPRSQTQRGDEP
jgi:hypothetical protein